MLNILLFLFLAFSFPSSGFDHGHDETIPCKNYDKKLTHVSCDCFPLPSSHACGSYALLHALTVEKKNGLRSDGDPLVEIVYAFKRLGIPNTLKAHCHLFNIQKTAKHLGLNAYFIRESRDGTIYGVNRDRHGEVIKIYGNYLLNKLKKMKQKLLNSQEDIATNHFFICIKLGYEHDFEQHLILMSVIKNGDEITYEVFDNVNIPIKSNNSYSKIIKYITKIYSKRVRSSDHIDNQNQHVPYNQYILYKK